MRRSSKSLIAGIVFASQRNTHVAQNSGRLSTLLQLQWDAFQPAQLKKVFVVCVPDLPRPNITTNGRVSMLLDILHQSRPAVACKDTR